MRSRFAACMEVDTDVPEALLLSLRDGYHSVQVPISSEIFFAVS